MALMLGVCCLLRWEQCCFAVVQEQHGDGTERAQHRVFEEIGKISPRYPLKISLIKKPNEVITIEWIEWILASEVEAGLEQSWVRLRFCPHLFSSSSIYDLLTAIHKAIMEQQITWFLSKLRQHYQRQYQTPYDFCPRLENVPPGKMKALWLLLKYLVRLSN